jgi:hypothetical protein
MTVVSILFLTYATANSKLRYHHYADPIRIANAGNLFISWLAGLLPPRRLPESTGGMVSWPQGLNVSSNT